MILSPQDWQAIYLSLQLASVTTIILLLLCLPLAQYLSSGQSWFKHSINALCTLPIILPPSVLGFYLLIAFAPNSPIGQTLTALNLPSLAFSFTGLVIASVIYSLPFVLQPLQMALRQLGPRPWEIASTIGLSPVQTFVKIIVPLIKWQIVTAAVLAFAHTIGEFGVILMIGGNIPGETQVLSVRIYEQVESLNYAGAHVLSGLLLGFSFIVLLLLYGLQKRTLKPHRLSQHEY